MYIRMKDYRTQVPFSARVQLVKHVANTHVTSIPLINTTFIVDVIANNTVVTNSYLLSFLPFCCQEFAS